MTVGLDVNSPPAPAPLSAPDRQDCWQTGGGTGLEKSLAGDGFGGLGRAISHRGDHGAACHREPESEGENPDEREKGPSQSTAENSGETSPKAVIVGHFNGVKPPII